MKNSIFNRTLSISLIIIFLAGLFPPGLFAQPSKSSFPGEIKGFNKSVFDGHFSRADRELDPDHWLEKARFGLNQAMCVWELNASNYYDDPELINDIKNQLTKFSDEELEKRFSKWLLGRFFGESSDKAINEYSKNFFELHKNYTWNLDENGNITFDDKTGDPLVIRPYNSEYNIDLQLWRDETKKLFNTADASYNNSINILYPELLAYIPEELRITMSEVLNGTISIQSSVYKFEFENIAAREENIFSTRRNRDIWSLRKKSENESAQIFTNKLIADTENICNNGINELSKKIEQAEANPNELTLLGEEWLRLYKEQFERGLKAWEDAEERFFIRRIEWEQETYKLYSEGYDIWTEAFNQFENEKQKWELGIKQLIVLGEKQFQDISESFIKNIEEVKNELEINMKMRIGDGKAKATALIDMYLLCANALFIAKENINFWKNSNNKNEILKAEEMYNSYMEKAIDARDRILSNYAELIGTGSLKDILSDDAASEDFCLDEYQIALLRAKTLVIYWEKRTQIAESVLKYADDLSSGRMTEGESLREWEETKIAYSESIKNYENELQKLNEFGNDIRSQQKILENILAEMMIEENKLAALNAEYIVYISSREVNLIHFYNEEYNNLYNNLSAIYESMLLTGSEADYWNVLENGILHDITETKQFENQISNMLLSNDLTKEERIMLNNLFAEISLTAKYVNWQETCNDLIEYFNSYGITIIENELPKIIDITYKILSLEGDVVQNTVAFLKGFDNCFYNQPQWLNNEINNWKDALLENISINIIKFDLDSEKSLNDFIEEYDSLSMIYNQVYDFYLTLHNDTDKEIIFYIVAELNKLTDKMMSSYYAICLLNTFNDNKIIVSNNNKYWREYLNNDYLNDNNELSLTKTDSIINGLLEDSLLKSAYISNRINDAFLLYSNNIFITPDKDLDYYAQMYEKYYYSDLDMFSYLDNLKSEFINVSKNYNIASLSAEEFKLKIPEIKSQIDAQRIITDEARLKYEKETEIFFKKSEIYDKQYLVSKSSYEDIENKKFEFEKQDAIQRWANTSYLDISDIELKNCYEKLTNAQIVLEVLTDLYNDEDRRPYNNPKYEEAYSAYEQSFSRKIKVMEAYDIFLSEVKQEKINNAKLMEDHYYSYMKLGYINFDYENYKLPVKREDYRLIDIITLNDGRLSFSMNNSMEIKGINEPQAEILNDFFNTQINDENNVIEKTKFSESVRMLSERMTGYLINDDKIKQWGLARTYFITKIIIQNLDISLLKDYYTGLGLLSKDERLGLLPIKRPFKKQIDLYKFAKEMGIISSSEIEFEYAYNSLSDKEKKDLEYYTILTLSGLGNDYISGFSEYFTFVVYDETYKTVGYYYDALKEGYDYWGTKLIYKASYEICKNTYGKLATAWDDKKKVADKWINGIKENLKLINNNYKSYIESSVRLEVLEGIKTDEQFINWNDINTALLKTGRISAEDISELESYWNLMVTKNSNKKLEFKNVSDALSALYNWSYNEEINDKAALNKQWNDDLKQHQENEEIFLLIVNNFINGSVNKNTLISAAEETYGQSAPAWKNHFSSMYKLFADNFSEYIQGSGNQFISVYEDIGSELIAQTETTLKNRYSSEMKARNAEWDQMLYDLNEKYNQWMDTVLVILERGREDWKENTNKMNEAFNQWHNHFYSEYERVNNEWAVIYLEGLEDKEKWLEMAAKAANDASSEAFISLIGIEGERLSRFIDAREPVSIRDAVPQVYALMAELLQSSGIVNAFGALNAINGITGTFNTAARGGLKGFTEMDSINIKTAAFEMAKKLNEEISNSEMRKLAYMAGMQAQEIIKELLKKVDSANKGFAENMDNVFITNNLWSKNGNKYKKEVVKRSTVFSPVITETAVISGYVNYIMEPVNLKTNMDENYLVTLNSYAIYALLDNVQKEIKEFSNQIFGKDGEKATEIINVYDRKANYGYDKKGNLKITYEDIVLKREKSPGKFGNYLGYAPAEKKSKDMGDTKESMFHDQGSGEIGRLITELLYWEVLEAKGYNELALAIWDKPLWDDTGSNFKAPSLRLLGQIVVAAIGAVVSLVALPVTGGLSIGAIAGIAGTMTGISVADDLIFNTLDLIGGYKTLDEAAFEWTKSCLIGFSSSFISMGFANIASSAVGVAVDTAGKIMTKTVTAGIQAATSTLVTSALNGITYNSVDKFSYNSDIFYDGVSGIGKNMLISMTSTLVSSTLMHFNSGFNLDKSIGFNGLQRFDINNINNLIGGLAGEAVGFALGDDFNLNILNFGLFTNGKVQSGLLELHFSRDGNTTMNFGTGGVNVSIDNIISSINGIKHWNVNNKIFNYGKKNELNDLIVLRAQYGYGDDSQKANLFDILKGDTALNFLTEGDYNGKTFFDEYGKKTINLTGYSAGMSVAEQFLLAVVLGHEAYRDGYGIGEYDTFGNLVTKESQFNELINASIARIGMGDRIDAEHRWFYETYIGLLEEKYLLEISKATGDKALFNDYINVFYNNDKDFLWLFSETGNDYQNGNSLYRTIPLLNSESESRVEEINIERKEKVYELYKNSLPEEEWVTFDDFFNNKTLKEKFEYEELLYTTIAGYGCMFMSTKYALETILGKKVDTLELHDFIKENKLTIKGTNNLLSNEKMAEIITKYSNGEFIVELYSVYNKSLTAEELNESTKKNYNVYNRLPTSEELLSLGASTDEFIAHLRIKDPSVKKPIIHSVMVSGFDYRSPYGKNNINYISVANPLKPSTYFNSRLYYSTSAIHRMDIFRVIRNTQ